MLSWLKKRYAKRMFNDYLYQYPYNKEIDAHFVNFLKLGIEPGTYKAEYPRSFPSPTTSNSVIAWQPRSMFAIKYYFWDRNRYYAWLMNGMFIYYAWNKTTKQFNETDRFTYTGGRPTYDLMLEFKNALEKSQEIEFKLL